MIKTTESKKLPREVLFSLIDDDSIYEEIIDEVISRMRNKPYSLFHDRTVFWNVLNSELTLEGEYGYTTALYGKFNMGRLSKNKVLSPYIEKARKSNWRHKSISDEEYWAPLKSELKKKFKSDIKKKVSSLDNIEYLLDEEKAEMIDNWEFSSGMFLPEELPISFLLSFICESLPYDYTLYRSDRLTNHIRFNSLECSSDYKNFTYMINKWKLEAHSDEIKDLLISKLSDINKEMVLFTSDYFGTRNISRFLLKLIILVEQDEVIPISKKVFNSNVEKCALFLFTWLERYKENYKKLELSSFSEEDIDYIKSVFDNSEVSPNLKKAIGDLYAELISPSLLNNSIFNLNSIKFDELTSSTNNAPINVYSFTLSKFGKSYNSFHNSINLPSMNELLLAHKKGNASVFITEDDSYVLNSKLLDLNYLLKRGTSNDDLVSFIEQIEELINISTVISDSDSRLLK